MNKVLNINIIGNGFDKMHGVDSTYFDFLKYLNEETNLPNTNYICSEMIEKNLNDTWIDCESYLNKLFNGFVKFKENKLEVKSSEELDIFLNYTNNKYGQLKTDYYDEVYKLGDIIKVLKENRIPREFNVIENDILKNIGSSETFLIEKMENDLLNDYYELRNELIKYLKSKEKKFCINSKFKDFVEKNKFNENSVCLNFNYTGTALNYFQNIHHIHGDLINENIVWGYYNCAMENICKSWQILCLNAGNEFFNELSMLSIPSAVTGININVLGHSISENDIILYDKIFDTIIDELSLLAGGEGVRDDFPITINYTYYDNEKQLGKDQISKVKNIKQFGLIGEYVIDRQKLNGINTKYEFS